MSWQSYVDEQLIATHKVSQAAILGLAGGVWATSAGFTLSPEEQTAILNGFKNPEVVQQSGLRLASQKYFAVNVGPELIAIKKGADGATLFKTKQAIIVGVYHAPIQQSENTTAVAKLGDYLISVGY